MVWSITFLSESYMFQRGRVTKMEEKSCLWAADYEMWHKSKKTLGKLAVTRSPAPIQQAEARGFRKQAHYRSLRKKSTFLKI